MGLTDFIAMGAILIIVALAIWYIVREKKRGVKCIGCPSGSHCSKSGNAKDGSDACCCCCNNTKESEPDLKKES